MPQDRSFAERLKRIRKDCDLTQKMVAEALGIGRSTYAYYETGKTSPDLQTLARLAALFRMSTDSLLGREPLPTDLHDDRFPFADAVVRRFSELTGDEQILILQFRQLTDAQREELTSDLRKHLRNKPPKENTP